MKKGHPEVQILKNMLGLAPNWFLPKFGRGGSLQVSVWDYGVIIP